MRVLLVSTYELGHQPLHLASPAQALRHAGHEVRTLDLKKQPSVSETIDWARVLVLLQASELGHEMVKDTLNVLLKYEADIEATLPHVTTFVAKASRQTVFG